jgi:ketosteroid isomerase-like protein
MSTRIIRQFAEAINSHDIARISELMTDDHEFIDPHGGEVSGREAMKAGWAAYFKWFPDYRIEITDVLGDGDTFGAFGFASGTYKGRHTADDRHYWALPAAWKIIVHNNKIRLWQVYADTKVPYDIIRTTD